MKHPGTEEYLRSSKGNSYIAVGEVLNPKKVGCPPCDVVYLQLYRDGKESLFLAMTIEEGRIISAFLREACDL